MKIKKCIIPIAGKGTRRLPITKSVSKEMLPILNEPTIMLLVKECLLSGIKEIVFVVNEDNYKMIEEFFTRNIELENFLKENNKLDILNDLNEIIDKIKFNYIIQDENIRGTSGAIYAAKKFIENNEYFSVIFGDDLIDSEEPYLKTLINEHEKYNCNVIGVKEIEEKYKNYYYKIKYKQDNVMDKFVGSNELIDSSNHMMLGRLILHGTILDKLITCKCHDNNEYFISDALISLNEEIRCVLCDGIYYNTGNLLEHLKANIAYGLKDDKIKEELLNYIKEQIK